MEKGRTTSQDALARSGHGCGNQQPDPSRALWPETRGLGSISLLVLRLLSQSPPAALDHKLWSLIYHCTQGRQQVPHKCQSAG